MTIDEAIKYYEEEAEEQDMKAGFETDYQTYSMSEVERERCRKCASDHRQLAEWLKRLKRIEDYIADGKDDIECTYSLRFYEIEAVMDGEIWRSDSE